MIAIWCTVLIVVLVTAWIVNWLGIPGNWIMVLAAAGYAWLVPGDVRVGIGWPVVAAAFVIALAGELAELLAGALGVKKAGGSRRGTILAIIGSIVGGIVGMFVGIPIPIVGSLVAAVLFGATGALVGAMLGEHWKGRTFDESLNVGQAAFLGRLAGTMAKIACGTVILAVVLIPLAVL